MINLVLFLSYKHLNFENCIDLSNSVDVLINVIHVININIFVSYSKNLEFWSLFKI